jgi:Xaa-Pro aminopeptidase
LIVGLLAMDPSRRLQGLRKSLAAQKLDFFLVTHLPNVRYLSGFTGSSAVLLVGESENALFTDGRYTRQAREEASAARVVIVRKSVLIAAGEWLAQRRRRAISVGIEGEHLSVAAEALLRDAVRRRCRLVAKNGVVERLRMIKDADEITRLRTAAGLGSKLFQTALNAVRPGNQETSVAAELEFAARRAGADGMSFSTIVAAGARSALPHGHASATPIPRRGFVVLDFGVILTGYCSDMTRTVHVGRPLAKHRGWYEAVGEAQLAAIAAVRAGASAGTVDAAARKVLKHNGLGRYFTHSTGHGVGLEIHEAPRIGAGELTILQPGMVITIEPGIYIPGQGGVRIEDMVVVRERDCEVLTSATKELIVV